MPTEWLRVEPALPARARTFLTRRVRDAADRRLWIPADADLLLDLGGRSREVEAHLLEHASPRRPGPA